MGLGSARQATAAPRRAAALAVLLLTLLAPAASRADTPEDAVKAVYLFKFAPFVGWPPSAFASTASPFRLCILGDDPFGATLDQAVSGHQIAAHPVEVRRLQAADGVQGCHIVYFRGPRKSALEDAFGRLKGAPVLTVTEASEGQSGGAGAVIQFVVRDGRVRFAIDAGAAAAGGMRISSKLLALAVKPRG